VPWLHEWEHKGYEQKGAPVREEYLRLANLEKPRKKSSNQDE
jgi:hypothetical protein